MQSVTNATTRIEVEQAVVGEILALDAQIGTSAHAVVERRLRQLRAHAPSLGKLHYLAFDGALVHRVYDEAFDELHQAVSAGINSSAVPQAEVARLQNAYRELDGTLREYGQCRVCFEA